MEDQPKTEPVKKTEKTTKWKYTKKRKQNIKVSVDISSIFMDGASASNM